MALLRGIDVGGRNKVAMRNLRAAFQADGYQSVATYIQSGNVLYFQRLSSRRTQSRMSKIVGKPEHQQMTIRSWATTTKLLALLAEVDASAGHPDR